MTFSSAFWWAIAGIALMVSEFVVPGLVLFFFGIGALVTALVAWLAPISLNVEIAIFIVTSLASLIVLRRFLKAIFMGRTSDTGTEESNPGDQVGSCGEVVQAIEPGKFGRIVLNGTQWKAQSDEAIAEGSLVEVVSRNNLTLVVKKKG